MLLSDNFVNNFKLRVGIHYVAGEGDDNSNNPDVQNFDISSEMFVTHEDFIQEGKNVKNDIALIKLPFPAELNQLTQPACWKTQKTINEMPVVVGWGKTDAAQTSDDRINGLYSSKQYKLEVNITIVFYLSNNLYHKQIIIRFCLLGSSCQH